MRNLIVNEILDVEWRLPIYPENKYKKGGQRHRENLRNIARRDELLAMLDKDLFNIFKKMLLKKGEDQAICLVCIGEDW